MICMWLGHSISANIVALLYSVIILREMWKIDCHKFYFVNTVLKETLAAGNFGKFVATLILAKKI